MPEQPPDQCTRPDEERDPEQAEIGAILRSLKQDLTLMGCFSLGKDGVLRSLTADRDVVDAVGLDPRQIAAFLRRIPSIEPASNYEGADGTKISMEEWFAPDKEKLLPPPLSGEEKEKAQKIIEEHPEIAQKRLEELKIAWQK